MELLVNHPGLPLGPQAKRRTIRANSGALCAFIPHVPVLAGQAPAHTPSGETRFWRIFSLRRMTSLIKTRNRRIEGKDSFGSSSTHQKASPDGRGLLAQRVGFACICALRGTTQIEEFTRVRAGSCTCRRHVRLHIRIPLFSKGKAPPSGGAFPLA